MGRRPNPYRARRLGIEGMRANVAANFDPAPNGEGQRRFGRQIRPCHLIDRTLSYDADYAGTASGMDRQLPAASTNQ
jgi:hypothetical protein